MNVHLVATTSNIGGNGIHGEYAATTIQVGRIARRQPVPEICAHALAQAVVEFERAQCRYAEATFRPRQLLSRE